MKEKETETDIKKEALKKLLQDDLYGEIPVFFKNAVIRDAIPPINDQIKVSDYNTKLYRNKIYYKTISKIF